MQQTGKGKTLSFQYEITISMSMSITIFNQLTTGVQSRKCYEYHRDILEKNNVPVDFKNLETRILCLSCKPESMVEYSPHYFKKCDTVPVEMDCFSVCKVAFAIVSNN